MGKTRGSFLKTVTGNLRENALPSTWLGLWIGIFASIYIFFFLGWSTFALRIDVLAGELWIAGQYIALGIALSLMVTVAASVFLAFRNRRLSIKTGTAVTIAALLFVLILIPLQILWVLGHRLSDPADPSTWTVPAIIFFVCGVAAFGGYLAFSRFLERQRKIGNSRLIVSAGLIMVAAGWLSRVLLLEGTGTTGSSSRKIVIIGLDGASWSLIDPMSARGELPNLQALIKNGTSGPLTSIEPIESPRVWTSIATGKTPAKHGIEQWVVDRRFIRTSTLWEIAEASGKKVGLYDWLVTHPPPKKANGFVIPGWLAGGKTSTYPEKLGRTLMFVRCLQHPFWLLRLVLFRLPPALIAELRGDPRPRLVETEFIRADLVDFDVPYLHSVYDPDLLAVVFYGTDVLAHHLMSSKSDARKGTLQAYYRKVDGIIGRIINHYHPPTTFVVLSDHGLRPLKEPKRIMYIRADRLLSDLNLTSVAHVFGGGNDYSLIGLNEVLDQDRQTSLEKVAKACNLIRSPTSNSPVFKAELSNGVIRVSVDPKFNPDQQHSIIVNGVQRKTSRYFRQVLILADHDLEGILILNGPGIRSGLRISGASVLDITPTLLHAMGLPVGQDMDGRVLADAITQTRLHDASIRFIPTYDLKQNADHLPSENHVDPEVLERLQALGYLK